ncbi:uncharacterized protein Dwil_GK27863 [Drosophila willistoni]|uniref:Uncharacterized protein n=1 Tax=Drosophila willistoni TaxID=7260 RepID=A0A0Q9WWV2_DROWI|nr:uncharacterized protein LOC26529865 [Drosophila willistoni]KRF99944.1 uncharacterized protein Dwil_GK27863 [Drosophila willistoni]
MPFPCDPLTNLPVKIDIEKIIAEFKPKEAERNIDEEKGPRDFLHLPDNNWVVLPSFKYQLEHLRPYLSCRNNKYLRSRYTKFLNNVPKNYVTISIYGTNINNMPKPRRMSLNGQFYGVDNKLAPIPIMDDPYSNKHNSQPK